MLPNTSRQAQTKQTAQGSVNEGSLDSSTLQARQCSKTHGRVPERICGLWHASHANNKGNSNMSGSNNPKRCKSREIGDNLGQEKIKVWIKNKCLFVCQIIKEDARPCNSQPAQTKQSHDARRKVYYHTVEQVILENKLKKQHATNSSHTIEHRSKYLQIQNRFYQTVHRIFICLQIINIELILDCICTGPAHIFNKVFSTELPLKKSL